jgi:hypothetical protein
MHIPEPASLPEAFCWTRFGPEAGESFTEILARKNTEREAGNGIFYWGIGSAVGRALRELISHVVEPEVLFSPITSAPRPADVSPAHVVRWTAGLGLFGERVVLPEHAFVTSRWDPERPGTARYALVCAADEPLRLDMHGELSFGSLRNFCSGAAVGASQVTAVVRRDTERPQTGRIYPVALRTSLAWPYLLRLTSPTPTDGRTSAAKLSLAV